MKARLKKSYRNEPVPFRYVSLEVQVRPFAKDVAFRWSRNGVPHLLVELGRNIVYSICYFGGSKSWRVYYPYANSIQETQTFNSVEDLFKFLKKHKSQSLK